MSDNSLDRLKARQAQARQKNGTIPSNANGASNSDALNDRYMAQFGVTSSPQACAHSGAVSRHLDQALSVPKQAPFSSKYPSESIRGWLSGPVSEEGSHQCPASKNIDSHVYTHTRWAATASYISSWNI